MTKKFKPIYKLRNLYSRICEGIKRRARRRAHCNNSNDVMDILIQNLSSESEKRLLFRDSLIVCFYFTIVGFAFDLINPEVSFIEPLISYVGGNLFQAPVTFMGNVGYLAISNFLASTFALLFLLFIRNPFWRAPLAGVCVGAVGFVHVLNGFVGIITVVWHGVFGTILFAIFVMKPLIFGASQSLFFVSREIMRGPNYKEEGTGLEEEIQRSRESLWELLKLIVQMMLAFAAITGVTMTILFRPGYGDPQVKLTGVQMAFGFFMSGVALYIWVAVPVLGYIRASRLLDRIIWSNNSKSLTAGDPKAHL